MFPSPYFEKESVLKKSKKMKHPFFSLLYTDLLVFEKTQTVRANIQKKGVPVSIFYFFKTLKNPRIYYIFLKYKFGISN